MTFLLVAAEEIAYNISELQNLENEQDFVEILTLTEGVTDDPRLMYYRAVALYATKSAQESADLFAGVISKTSPFKFKAILKLKELCIEYCELRCEERYNTSIFGKDGFAQMQNLTAWRLSVLEKPDIEQIDQLLAKCGGDGELAILKVKQLLHEGNFSQAKNLLQNIQEPQLFNLLDRIASAIDFTFEKFGCEEVDGTFLSHLSRLCFIENTLGSSTLLMHKPKGVAKLQKAVGDLDCDEVVREIGVIRTELEKVLSRVYNTDFKLPMETYFTQLEQYLQLIPGAVYLLRNERALEALDDRASSSHNAVALTSVQRAFEIFTTVSELRLRFEAREDIDKDLQLLEQDCEATRRALNVVKFNRVGSQLQKIDHFIDEINAVFDVVAQLRVDSLVPDFYYLLNVTKDSSIADIKRNYYKKAQQLHPDNLPADLAADEKKSKQREFELIAEAYSVLTDKNKREIYEKGMYGAEERSQRISIHNNRKQAAYNIPPDYVGKGNMISDEEMRKFMTEQQWNDYMRNKKFGKA